MDQPSTRFLIRFSGDLGTKKGRAFVQFRSRLARNIRDAMHRHDIPFSLEISRGRFYLNTEAGDAGPVIARIFGIQSFSAIHTRPFSTLEDIVEEGEKLFTDSVKDKTFAVRARRSMVRDQISFTSEDIERALGARLLDRSAGVDLSRPQATVWVELSPWQAHFFDGVVRGPGGLPLGCEGKALALVSGGIDSVAAAWLMLKRGLQLDYLFYNMGDQEHASQVFEIVKKLTSRWSYGSEPRLFMLDLRPWVHELRERTDPKLWQVLLKRLMVIGAQELTDRSNSTALVTGESLGQVSSQTLDNLAVIEESSSIPILRPLLGFDKSEIIDLAKRIGTFELSAKIPEYCALNGRGPTISADRQALAEAESSMDLDAFRASLAEVHHFDFCSEPERPAGEPSLALDKVPSGSTIIDLRSSGAFENWHFPGALRLDYREALRAADHVERGPTYLICCEVEFKSADIAERFRRAGHEAYYFRGGTGQLLRYAAERELVEIRSVAAAHRD